MKHETGLRYYVVYDFKEKTFVVTNFPEWLYNKDIELISAYKDKNIALNEALNKNLGF